MDIRQLERGKRYRVRYRIPGVQFYDRESVLVYLWPASTGTGELEWSARPAAGTQSLDPRWIKSIELVDGDVACYVARRAPK
jgi:hypothetical protein